MLRQVLGTREDGWATLPLRVSLGVIFIVHGGQKLFGWFGGYGLAATAAFFEQKLGMTPGLLWAGLVGGGELFGGLFILLGLLTRLWALDIAIIMSVAIVKVHWGSFVLPAGFEYALALLCSAMALLITGGGPLSIDARITRRAKGAG